MNTRLTSSVDGPLMRTLSIVAAVVTASVATSTFGQTVYSWEDKDGTHYTDDPSQIPKSAKKVESAKMAPAPAGSSTSPVGVAPSPGPSAPKPTTVAPDEQQWRERFIQATRKITSLKESAAALEKSLPPATSCVTANVTVSGSAVTTVPIGTPGSHPSQQCYPNALYEQMKAQLAQKQVELHDAERALEDLDAKATREAIPREWRRGW